MGLLDDPAALSQLFDHLRREGDVDHFYYDDRGFITIAIGVMVDVRHGTLAARRAVADDFAMRWHARFARRGGGGASQAAVLGDWDRVAALPIGSRSRADCRTKCQYYIPNPADRRAMAMQKVTNFYTILVTRRPYMAHYHSGIQLAFVDTLYNPGIDTFEMSGDRSRMWHALNPAHAQYDPLHARHLFERIWRAVEPARQRYQNRVTWRLERFEEGLRHNPAVRTPVWRG